MRVAGLRMQLPVWRRTALFIRVKSGYSKTMFRRDFHCWWAATQQNGLYF